MLSRSNTWGRSGNSSIIKEKNSGILFLSEPCTKILNCPSDIIMAIAVCIFGQIFVWVWSVVSQLHLCVSICMHARVCVCVLVDHKLGAVIIARRFFIELAW